MQQTASLGLKINIAANLENSKYLFGAVFVNQLLYHLTSGIGSAITVQKTTSFNMLSTTSYIF